MNCGKGVCFDRHRYKKNELVCDDAQRVQFNLKFEMKMGCAMRLCEINNTNDGESTCKPATVPLRFELIQTLAQLSPTGGISSSETLF